MQFEALRESAVLVPLVDMPGGPTLLFTVRPQNLRRHAGQISFPGGAREPQDVTPVATALREANEELGILPSDVTVVGALDELPTVTDFRIHPVVGLLPPGLTYWPDPQEVAEMLEVPLRQMARPGAVRVEPRTWRGQAFDVHFYDHGEHVIWGATGRILKNLLEVCEDLPSFQEWMSK